MVVARVPALRMCWVFGVLCGGGVGGGVAASAGGSVGSLWCGGFGPRNVGVAGAGPLLLALVVGLCVGVPVVSYSPAPWWGQYHWRWGA